MSAESRANTKDHRLYSLLLPSAVSGHAGSLLLFAAALLGVSTERGVADDPKALAKRRIARIALDAAPRNQMSDEQFAQYVFRQDRNVEGAQQKLESQLRVQIEGIQQACPLSPAQQAKLQLMGRGDIKRFLQEYDNVMQRFKEFDNDTQRLQEIMPGIQRLQRTIQGGLFDAGSLFAKSLHHTLTAEQFTKYEEAMNERRAFRHRAQVEAAVALLEQTMPLRAEQRQKLIDLFAKEIKPIQKQGQYDLYLIMYRISRIPEEKFGPWLSAAQRKSMERQVARYSFTWPNLRARPRD